MADHRAIVLAHLAVVRHVEGVLVAHGVATGPAVTAALALVERQGRDGDVGGDALKAAASAASDETQDGRLAAEPSRRAAMWLATAAGNACWLARKERGWKDAPRTILDAAAYSLSSLRVPGLEGREDLAQRALAAEAAVPPASARTKSPGPPRLKKVGETPELGELASAWWQRQKPRRDPRRQTDAATLAALLRARALPVTDAVLAFEARYGGIRFCEPGGAGVVGEDVDQHPAPEGDEGVFHHVAGLFGATEGLREEPALGAVKGRVVAHAARRPARRWTRPARLSVARDSTEHVARGDAGREAPRGRLIPRVSRREARVAWSPASTRAHRGRGACGRCCGAAWYLPGP